MLAYIIRKLNMNIFYANLGLVVGFTLLYYLQDRFMINNKELALKLGLLEHNYNQKYYSNQGESVSYYFWYSLITQTTVGYNGALDTQTGKSVSFIHSPNRLFKLLNVLQLLSVLMVISSV
jgi:hypothetical protein